MPRQKNLSALNHFINMTSSVGSTSKASTYKCKYCSKCLTAGSSSRLQCHLESCVAYQEQFDMNQNVSHAQSSQSVGLNLLSPLNITTAFESQSPVLPNASTSTSTPASLPVKKDGSCSLKSSNNSIIRFTDTISSKQVEKAKKALALWMYAENVPFSMVDSSFFQDFVASLRPAFNHFMPSAYELGTPLLNDHYNNLKSRVLSIVNDVDFVCIISDGWSNIRGDSIINFMLTTPHPIFLKCINATGDSHTGKFFC